MDKQVTELTVTAKRKPHYSLIGKLPETGYVRQSQLIPAIVPFSSATLWRKVKAGSFPCPVKLAVRVTAWNADDIRQYLADPAGYRAPGV